MSKALHIIFACTLYMNIHAPGEANKSPEDSTEICCEIFPHNSGFRLEDIKTKQAISEIYIHPNNPNCTSSDGRTIKMRSRGKYKTLCWSGEEEDEKTKKIFHGGFVRSFAGTIIKLNIKFELNGYILPLSGTDKCIVQADNGDILSTDCVLCSPVTGRHNFYYEDNKLFIGIANEQGLWGHEVEYTRLAPGSVRPEKRAFAIPNDFSVPLVFRLNDGYYKVHYKMDRFLHAALVFCGTEESFFQSDNRGLSSFAEGFGFPGIFPRTKAEANSLIALSNGTGLRIIRNTSMVLIYGSFMTEVFFDAEEGAAPGEEAVLIRERFQDRPVVATRAPLSARGKQFMNIGDNEEYFVLTEGGGLVKSTGSLAFAPAMSDLVIHNWLCTYPFRPTSYDEVCRNFGLRRDAVIIQAALPDSETGDSGENDTPELAGENTASRKLTFAEKLEYEISGQKYKRFSEKISAGVKIMFVGDFKFNAPNVLVGSGIKAFDKCAVFLMIDTSQHCFLNADFYWLVKENISCFVSGALKIKGQKEYCKVAIGIAYKPVGTNYYVTGNIGMRTATTVTE